VPRRSKASCWGVAISHEYVEIVRRAVEAFNRRDHDGALADFHWDVEWRDLMHAPDAPEYVRGVAGVRAIAEQWDETFDMFTAEVEEYVDAGDCVVSVTHWSGKGKGSGVTIDLHSAEVYEFTDSKIVRVTQGYADKAAALEVVKLRK
jgi:ketosteroid isomerase-like protein